MKTRNKSDIIKMCKYEKAEYFQWMILFIV